ncbi:hypothetical protein [Kitasatospora aureofaciens]|uniref:hypothetical protein n=1 Tax=Kitasatospora aureofaciens TaxID=1894 RepID=UPI0033D13D04
MTTMQITKTVMSSGTSNSAPRIDAPPAYRIDAPPAYRIDAPPSRVDSSAERDN